MSKWNLDRSGFSGGRLPHSVYLDAETEYHPVRERIVAAYGALKPGGVLAGAGYLDGIFEGKVYGVRTAVNEFAREHWLVIRLTLEKIQSWFTLKPISEPLPKPKIAVLTAWDGKQHSLASVSTANKRRYCELHGYDFVEENTSAAAGRHPVWAKIPLIRKYLDRYEWVFWTDVDSLVMDMQVPLERFCDPRADMLICHEDLAIGIYNLTLQRYLRFGGARRRDWMAA